MREPGHIEQRIKDDSIAALKAGEKRLREALSSFAAALKKERIDRRKEPTEAEEVAVLRRECKRRLEALEVYERAGRDDLAECERYEHELLKGYLPEELGDDELGALVDEAIAATEATSVKELGAVMGWLKPKVAGRADGKRLSGLVREKLGG